MEPLLCLTKADLADPDDAAVDLPLARRAVGGHPARRRPRPSCGSGSPAGSACWSAPAASASRRWSTRWCPTRCARSASSTRSPAGAGTPRRRRTCWRCRTTGGWIIDTPGIRSFGLAHVQPEDLIEAFPDLDEMTEDCPRGCTHGDDEPECGLDAAVEPARRTPTGWRRSGGCWPPGAFGLLAQTAGRLPASTVCAAGVAGEDGRRPASRARRTATSAPRSIAGGARPACAARRPGRDDRANAGDDQPQGLARSSSCSSSSARRARRCREPVAVEEVLAAQVGHPDRPGGDETSHDQRPAQPVAHRERDVAIAPRAGERPEDDRGVHDEHVQRKSVDLHACT